MSKPRKDDGPVWAFEPVQGHCPRCAKPLTLLLRHWDVVVCSCSLKLWALRPKKNGPLQLFLHPGLPEGERWLNPPVTK